MIILIGKDGKEHSRLPNETTGGAWLNHAGKLWGFGTARQGDRFYYEADKMVSCIQEDEQRQVDQHNPHCDGGYCKSVTGEVRKLPYGSAGGNMILCRACFDYEISSRAGFVHFDKELGRMVPSMALPAWESLEVYPEPTYRCEYFETDQMHVWDGQDLNGVTRCSCGGEMKLVAPKSEMVKRVATQQGIPVTDIPLSETPIADIKGLPKRKIGRWD